MISSFWPQTLVDWAQVISAIATAASVMVALRLASRNERERLDLTTISHHEITIGGAEQGASARLNLVTRITNIGQRPVEIASVSVLQPLARTKWRWFLWDLGWSTRQIPVLFRRMIGMYIVCHSVTPIRRSNSGTNLIAFGEGLECIFDIDHLQINEQIDECVNRCVLVVQTASHHIKYRRFDAQQTESISQHIKDKLSA